MLYSYSNFSFATQKRCAKCHRFVSSGSKYGTIACPWTEISLCTKPSSLRGSNPSFDWGETSLHNSLETPQRTPTGRATGPFWGQIRYFLKFTFFSKFIFFSKFTSFPKFTFLQTQIFFGKIHILLKFTFLNSHFLKFTFFSKSHIFFQNSHF